MELSLRMYSKPNFNSIKVRLELTIFAPEIKLLTHFNSIKVRLERYSQNIPLYRLDIFQFHKGTIRTRATLRSDPQRSYFNSIKVRLEQPFKTGEQVISFNFNSIKVRLERLSAFPYPVRQTFQFHKGTIRTCGWR